MIPNLKDELLAKDLVRGGISAEVVVPMPGLSLMLCTQGADQIVNSLAEAASKALRAVADAAAEAGSAVHCWKHKDTYRICFGPDSNSKPYFVVQGSHYDKLRSMYDSTAGAQRPDFHEALLCLLVRYEALGGHGYQCALTETAFDELHNALGVIGECFASPLNCRLPSYCSAFDDLDGYCTSDSVVGTDCIRWFGSAGSFFNAFPTEGSFEANPPFIPQVTSNVLKFSDKRAGDECHDNAHRCLVRPQSGQYVVSGLR